MENIEKSSPYCKELSEYIGQVRMWGDPLFDCDSVKNTADSQIRWLSYPLSRLVLNPNTVHCTGKEYLPMQNDLDLIIGYLTGDQSVRPSYQKQHCMVSIGVGDNALYTADSVKTTWYPYQISYSADYGQLEVTLNGYDFFTGPNSIIRVLELDGRTDDHIHLSGTGDSAVSWERNHGVLLISNEHYYYALRIVSLEDFPKAREIVQTPSLNGSAWSLNTNVKKAAFGYGFATKEEGSLKAIERAKACFDQTVSENLTLAKAFWNETLGNVPTPKNWGITAVDSQGVTPEQHRNRYYAAWAFLISNMLAETPERGFPYKQMTIGKAAMWFDGSALCPSNCAWESFFAIQMLALLYPETAWSATEGFMSMIDEDGWLDGECLPSQKAHTAWVVYSIASDLERLRAIYPAIRRYLLWREENPYWIWSPGGPEKPREPLDHKDICFVSQWMTDVDYTILICNELGYFSDAEMWRQKKDNMLDNVKKWFFAEDEVFGLYMANSGTREDNALFTIDMLVHKLNPDLDERLVDYYLRIHDPAQNLAGLEWSKYGNIYHTLMGLYDRHLIKQADELADALITHMLQVRDFCEVEKQGIFEVEGVNPSAFSACQIIGLTWMRNGMRYEKGEPYAMAFGRGE